MKILESVNALVWGLPALAAILGVGLYLTVRTGFVQLRLFHAAFRRFAGMFRKGEKGDDFTGRQALFTALAATVGTGNLVGVAGAICLGGPGAVFWMWIAGLLGMCTKYCEALLAVRYRVKRDGEFHAGPMYIISRGMGDKWKPMALVYAAFGVFASFGVGNATQISSVIGGISGLLPGEKLLSGFGFRLLFGIALGLLIWQLLMGGGKRIGKCAEMLVPVVSGGYIILCLMALICRWRAVPQALCAIFQGAWDPRSVTGGAVGSMFAALRVGCARGVFTNEAGLGTAGIAHGAALVKHPAQQGLMGIMEVFQIGRAHV